MYKRNPCTREQGRAQSLSRSPPCPSSCTTPVSWVFLCMGGVFYSFDNAKIGILKLALFLFTIASENTECREWSPLLACFRPSWPPRQTSPSAQWYQAYFSNKQCWNIWRAAEYWGEAAILFNIPLWSFPAYQQKVSSAAAARSGAASIYFWKCVLNPVRIISLKNSAFISYFIFCSAVISPTENCNWGAMIRILWAIWVMLSLNEKMRDSTRTLKTPVQFSWSSVIQGN